MEAGWTRLPAFLPGPLAQLAEQLTLNQLVVGSSPTWVTRIRTIRPLVFLPDPEPAFVPSAVEVGKPAVHVLTRPPHPKR